MRVLAIVCAAASICLAQTGEITPDWNRRKTFDSLSAQLEQIRILVEQVKPAQWESKEASELYSAQATEARNQISYLLQNLGQLAQRTDTMTVMLETFLRLQALESTLDSLNEGVRRYQQPELASSIQSLISKSGNDRRILREYLIELVAHTEKELQTANQEAQRCRASLIRQPRSNQK
jgi:hypothetical protein